MQLNQPSHSLLKARASGLSRWLLFSILITWAIPLPSIAALLWNYSSTDGTTLISGQFQTDGEFSDTQGSGIHEFTILEWYTFDINGQEPDWNTRVNSNRPTIPVSNSDRNKFTWSQSSGQFLTLGRTGDELADHSILATSPRGPASSNFFRHQVYIADHNHTSRPDHDRRSIIFELNSGNVSFIPTSTILTPVPEPAEAVLISIAAMVGFVILKRRKRTKKLQRIEVQIA